MKVLSVIIILLLAVAVFSQTENKKSKKDLNKILSEQSKFISECEKETKEFQLKNFGRVPLKISGECEWNNNGCPMRIVKPVYPDAARKAGLTGTVKVEIIVDQTGKTIYSKAIKGKKIFYQNAEQAARLSLYYPKVFCGRTVWQRKYIVYNFLPTL